MMTPLTDRIRIQTEDFSVEAEIGKMKAVSKRVGAVVTFLGTARDFSEGRSVCRIDFEHYAGMAEQRLAALREEALKKYRVMDVTILHRIGTILPGENIVLVVVGAERRAEAFAACAWCIDTLKQTVPIWKKEITPDGDQWVTPHP
jgi:molybdopterin synthase catalytic subunit